MLIIFVCSVHAKPDDRPQDCDSDRDVFGMVLRSGTDPGRCGSGSTVNVPALLFALLESLDVVAEFQGGAELQPHVLHHHVTP